MMTSCTSLQISLLEKFNMELALNFAPSSIPLLMTHFLIKCELWPTTLLKTGPSPLTTTIGICRALRSISHRAVDSGLISTALPMDGSRPLTRKIQFDQS